MAIDTRRPFGDLTNRSQTSFKRQPVIYKDAGLTDSDSSIDLGDFKPIQYQPADASSYTNEISVIDDLDSLSLAHNEDTLGEDSLERLPDRRPHPKSHYEPPKAAKTPANPTYKSTGAKKPSQLSLADDKESESFKTSESVLLKARLESLRTKYDMLLAESQEKLLALQKEFETKTETKINEQKLEFTSKCVKLEENFVKEKELLVNDFEAEKRALSQRILSLESSNSSLATLLETQKNENETLSNEIEQLKAHISQLEQRESIAQAEIAMLESRRAKTSGSSRRSSEIRAMHTQIKALEDALVAERALSDAKIATIQQELHEEHEGELLVLEEKTRSEMHAEWKRRLCKIKASWSQKKRSLINKVTKSFEKNMVWEKEKKALLAQLQSRKLLKDSGGLCSLHRTCHHQNPLLDDDSLNGDDLFSDSFKIDEDVLFGQRRPSGTAKLDFRSPLLQKTPHFMSKSSMPLMATSPFCLKSSSPK